MQKKADILLYIKEIRNKLAHGESKYSEACRDKTFNEIAEYVDVAYYYMLELIESFEKTYKTG